MITQLFLCKRPSGMSRDEFGTYWKDTHAPIAQKIPGLQQYIQYHGIADANGEPAVDGVALMTFRDADAMRSAWESPEGKAAMEDAPNFVDASQLVVATFEGHQIV